MSELKRCPFCGGDNVGVWHNRPVSPLIADSYEVHCYDCNFGLSPKKERDEAIETWNTRIPMQNIVERLKKKHEESTNDYHDLQDPSCLGEMHAYRNAIEFVKEEGGIE